MKNTLPNWTTATYIIIVQSALAALWAYVAYSKFADISHFKILLRNQVFPVAVADLLSWLIPSIAMLLVILLCYKPWLSLGFMLSICLLFIFSSYITLVMANTFNRIPCSCAGFSENMNWSTQLLINMALLLLSSTALYLTLRK